MKMDIKKQTRLLIWIPLVLSLIIIVSGVFGINVVEGVPTVDIFSFVFMCISYVLIVAFTLVADIKRPDTQWNTKPLYIIQAIGLLVFLFAVVSKNMDLSFTVLMIFGIIYFITLIIYLLLKKKLTLNEKHRSKVVSFIGDLPYEYTSKKIYAFSKISGILIIVIAILGIIFMYSNGYDIYRVLPFALVTIAVYILSKVFIIQHEKAVEKRITTDFYYKLNGSETIRYIDKLLKEKLHKDKEYELKLVKVEILEYLGEHESARKLYRSLGKPTQFSEFTYEFLGLDYLDKTDEESYIKALKRIEKKISTLKKEKDIRKVTSLLEEYKLEVYIRFNKKIDERKLVYFSNAHYQLTRIRNNYILGRYYFNQKDYEEAKSRLEYVIKYGGELKKFTHSAQKIIDRINQNGK